MLSAHQVKVRLINFNNLQTTGGMTLIFILSLSPISSPISINPHGMVDLNDTQKKIRLILY